MFEKTLTIRNSMRVIEELYTYKKMLKTTFGILFYMRNDHWLRKASVHCVNKESTNTHAGNKCLNTVSVFYLFIYLFTHIEVAQHYQQITLTFTINRSVHLVLRLFSGILLKINT